MRAVLARMWRVYGAVGTIAWQAARWRAAAVLASAVVVGLTGAATGLLTKLVIDALADGAASRALAMGIAFLALVAVSSLVEDLGAVLLQSDLGERMSQAVEQRLMAVSAAAPGLEHLERPEFADRVKLVRDRSFLPYFALGNLNGLATVFFGLAAAVPLLGSVHPLLMLMPAVAVPGAALQFRAYRRHFARYDETAPEERLAAHYLQLATEPPAAKEVRLFALGPHLVRRHRQVSDAYIRTLFRDQLRRAASGVASGALYGAAVAGAIGFVGWLALEGRATLGDVALGVQVTTMAIGQVQSATRQTAALAELSFVGERYLWLLEYRPAVQVRPPGQARPAPAALREGITLEDVRFTYPGTQRAVLDGVSLVLPAGSTVALVGENGAGKTSLVKLLCRFYDPTSGRILVDGSDLRDLDLQAWRERTAVVFQDFVRFQLLAREAVGVGDLPAAGDLARVGVSTRLAGAEPVIARLPAGLETQLGRLFAGGVELSDGEWQRLALARGLMRPGPLLLILDEPTASLDARAEHEVFQRFARMARPIDAPAPTTLLVSHRFSTVRMADLIVVLHDGRVEEAGSHDQLVASGGRYAQLFRLQASRYQP
ncbi:MAG TPA: ABC transporter ATP-binding protein [Egibacteraceae bacterium]|nr:ABC transporter ATP-binding protein [Egibacteraceae bacterium]